jgi:hypothetical protein
MPDLTVLSNSGMDIDSLPAAEKEALNRLDQSEVDTLAAIRTKLNEEPEVSGHLAKPVEADGVIVW